MLAGFITAKSLGTHVWFLPMEIVISSELSLDSESKSDSDRYLLSGSLKPWNRSWELYNTRKGKAGGAEWRHRSPDQNCLLNAQQEITYDWDTTWNWYSSVLSGGHSYFLLRFWLHHTQPRISRRCRLKNDSLNTVALQPRKSRERRFRYRSPDLIFISLSENIGLNIEQLFTMALTLFSRVYKQPWLIYYEPSSIIKRVSRLTPFFQFTTPLLAIDTFRWEEHVGQVSFRLGNDKRF